MIELVTIKRVIIIEDIGGFHHYSAITFRYLAQKKSDPEVFLISCTTNTCRFTRALCDLGAIINLISLVVFK